jgi:PEGA domain
MCVCVFVTIVAGAPSSTAQAAPLRVAIVPLRDSNPGAGDAAAMEAAVVEAARATPTLYVTNAAAGGTRLRGASAPTVEQTAQKLARDTNAERVLHVELARLGDDHVLYLQALDARGHAVGSATVHLPSGEPHANVSASASASASAALRAALVRALDPARNVGRIVVRVDVGGAEVQIDGKRSPNVADVPVGTHAVRVTHPRYRDFLRFVDVEYDRTASVLAALSAYPLTEGEMSERERKKIVRARVPWWRSWWALTIAAGVVTGVTAGAIYGSRANVGYDRAVTFQPPPGP